MRSSWDDYFHSIAAMVATRATCPRLSVGAVLVRNRQIISTGYNGAPRGLDHCDEIGCFMEAGHCIRAVHAEVNVVAQAARNGINTDGAKLYVTHTPCKRCAAVLINAGILIADAKNDYP